METTARDLSPAPGDGANDRTNPLAKRPANCASEVLHTIGGLRMSTINRRNAIMAASVPVALLLPAPSMAAQASEPDPIFALIDAHKAAVAEFTRLCGISSAMPCAGDAFAEADAKTNAALDLADDVQIAVMSTKPTTVAGAAAVLRYVATFWVEANDSCDRGSPVYETLALGDTLGAGEGFLPTIADAQERLAAR
jgi:hypothetical protein